MKAKIDKNLLKNLYLDEGFTSPEIAKKLNIKVNTVKMCIKRNFGESKLQHKRARLKRKEVEKAINYEATRCMSDGSFIKKNPSIYKTNSNGDIIVNAPEEVLTWDVPKKLKNDDSTELYNKRVIKKYRDTSNESLN
ncbi:hypothetical protein CLPUN_08490 [Clostridium puniceum]|uniref:Uncharacterized protein n=1 Tax=Clostridium puniceum TaxID=29367 RepID=A0A1S8TWP0_9CLOT|nr:DNA-binding response regulator [Clostridium puniceum]OOM81805.1 hypothetical protein CLPUN_08490 [Clostridium puniceum]